MAKELMNNSKIAGITSKLEQELKDAPSFECFSQKNGTQFLTSEIGRDLAKLISERKVKKRDLFLDANIHENYGYQLLSGKREPSREVLLSLFLALHLTYEEANQFLMAHGFAPLYVRKQFDAAVIYSLLHGWSVVQCNELLYDAGLPLLKKENS